MGGKIDVSLNVFVSESKLTNLLIIFVYVDDKFCGIFI